MKIFLKESEGEFNFHHGHVLKHYSYSFCFSAQLAASSRADQRASCVGIEGSARTSRRPPPLLRSRTLPAIIVPGVNILQAQLGNYNQGKNYDILKMNNIIISKVLK